MGSTLYNKIYLGRSPLLGSRRLQVALAVGVAAGLSLTWLALRAVR